MKASQIGHINYGESATKLTIKNQTEP